MNECRDLGEDAVAWRRHWLAGLAGLVGADLAVGGELAGLRSGAPRDLGTADWGWENGFDRGGWLNALDLLRDAPSYSPLLASYAGWEDGAALRRSDLVGERAWRATAECQLVDRAIGADHAVYCFRAVAGVADESSGSFLLRGVGGGDFTPRDTSVVREGHAALGPLIRPDARRHRPTPSDERPPAGPACDANFRGKSGETRGKWKLAG